MPNNPFEIDLELNDIINGIELDNLIRDICNEKRQIYIEKDIDEYILDALKTEINSYIKHCYSELNSLYLKEKENLKKRNNSINDVIEVDNILTNLFFDPLSMEKVRHNINSILNLNKKDEDGLISKSDREAIHQFVIQSGRFITDRTGKLVKMDLKISSKSGIYRKTFVNKIITDFVIAKTPLVKNAANELIHESFIGLKVINEMRQFIKFIPFLLKNLHLNYILYI